MDWDRAIEINQAALTRIVAALIAMVEMAAGGTAALLPASLYNAVSRMLLPTESAVRRLIVIAARGLKVKPAPARPMPLGLALARNGGVGNPFQLFDARKRFGPASLERAAATANPRIHVFAYNPLIPLFQTRPAESPVPEPDEAIDAARLGRRLAAVRMALENLPRQARRMVRWQARRDRMQSPAFRSPFRPGPPPGHRKKPKDEIDFVLRECHALASDVLNEDTS